MELRHLQFVHLPYLQAGQLGILLNSVAYFFLPPIKTNHSISWSDPCKMNIIFATETSARQVYMQSKLDDSTASYIFAN